MVTTPDYKAGDEPSAVLDIAEHLRVAIKLLQQKKKSCPEGGVDLTIAQSHVIAAISCLMQSQHLDD